MILYNASSSYYSMIGRLALLEARIPFESKRMDIHIAKEQLSPWYQAINPMMTVPTLVDCGQVLTDSEAILKLAASIAGIEWDDSDPMFLPDIEKLVKAHYAISIEYLTFGKALISIPPLRVIVPKMLQKIIKNLETEAAYSANSGAVQAKIELNQKRLAYFTEGNREDKLKIERDNVIAYLEMLPVSNDQLVGKKLSSVDIVTAVLCGRLKMIGEYGLIQKKSALDSWFERFQMRPAFKQADIWLSFQPLRILLKR